MVNFAFDDEDLGEGSGGALDDVTMTTLEESRLSNDSFIPDPEVLDTNTTSTAILAVVAVSAFLVLLLFFLATIRYRFAHKGSYLVREFHTDSGKYERGQTAKVVNVYDIPAEKEFYL